VPKQHQTQHRARSEERERNVLISELHRENQSLRRQVARLNKELARLVEAGVSAIKKHPSPMKDPPAVVNPCPTCGVGPIKFVKLPTGMLGSCLNCNWRGKMSTKE
jgi:hypothetical protein